MPTFGENLKAIRKERNLSQEEIAAQLGTSKQVISRYENGQRMPKISVATHYANRLHVPLTSLLTDSPTTNPIKGGIAMNNPITLNELLLVASVRRLDVTVTLTRTLTATIQVDSNDLGQWDEISHLYGEFAVREISLTGDALAVSITPPTRVKLTKGGE